MKFKALTWLGVPALALLGMAGTARSQVVVLQSANQANQGFFGGAVSGVPDVNGDGRGDMIVGASNETSNGFQGAGRAYILSGIGVGGNVLHVLDSPNPRTNGAFGLAVAGSPDIDGDGGGDVIVGAPNEGLTPLAFGRAYVFSGATGNLICTLNSPNPQVGGSFGTSVAWVPDVSGDGKPDVVVGAPNENAVGDPSGAGRVYVFNGLTGELISQIRSFTPAAQGSFGFSVAGVRDMNGDGRGDVVIGAPREGNPVNSGRIHFHNGLNGNHFFTRQSPNMAANGFFGYSLAQVPDATGDGLPDVAVGAPFEHPGTTPLNCGRAYVYDGHTAAFWKKLLPVITMPDMQFGISVGGVPDMNGDGRGDVIVGSWRETPASSPLHCGRAHVYSGATGLLIVTFASPRKTQDGRFGGSVAGVPDTNANGKGDVVIGAAAEPGVSGPTQAGSAYLIKF